MPRPRTPYRLKDGTIVPGVTTVNKAMSGDPGGLMYWAWKLGTEGKDYRKERDKAAGIGTIVHAMIEGNLLGKPADIPTSDDFGVTIPEYVTMNERAAVGYGAYLQWKSSTKLEIISCEIPMVSEEYRFGGTPDALATLNDILILLDWKAANHLYSQYIVQVAGYIRLVKEVMGKDPESAVLLRVGKDEGDFHVSAWPRPILDKGWTAFLHCLEIYKLKQQLDKVV